jgi:hypothetical protein
MLNFLNKINPIRIIKDKIEERRYRKKVEERMKKLKEEDPYIYD